MRCPIDGETLIMADRNGVEIDYCPKCRGVWLDRGELDKIIDRAMVAPAFGAAPAAAARGTVAPVYQSEPGAGAGRPDAGRATDDTRRMPRDDDDDDDRSYRRKRRESFLGDIFDF